MRLPKFSSLYGRIFAIFWFTMFLVLLAVLALPHLDPRKAHDIPSEHFQRMLEVKHDIEQRYKNTSDLGRIIFELEGGNRSPRDGRPRYFLTDLEGSILTTRSPKDFKLKALQNFITTIESPEHPKQKLYGHYLVAGPLPITLANQNLLVYVGFKWNEPPPFLLRMFDRRFNYCWR